MKFKTLITLLALTFLPFVVVVQPAFAANKCATVNNTSSAVDAVNSGIDCAAGAKTGTATSTETLSKKLSTILNLLAKIVGVIAVIMIIVAGVKFVTSGGNKEQVSSARSTIVYAIVGLIVVAVAEALVHFVLNGVATP